MQAGYVIAAFPAQKDGRIIMSVNNAKLPSTRRSFLKSASVAGMAKNAEAFIDALGLKQVDLLGFSIGGMVAQ